MEMIRNHGSGRDPGYLHSIVGLAFAIAADMKAKHLEQRSESWRSFVVKQVATGAAVVHRPVKRDVAPCVEVATYGRGANRTASAQAILQQDLVPGQNIWHRLGDVPSAPWRAQAMPAELAPITSGDITRLARSFPTKTSIGCDAVPPTVMVDLSKP